ncbi:phosphate ABC transporter substrate-binding protein [Colwelliaceae bacterium 6471]
MKSLICICALFFVSLPVFAEIAIIVNQANSDAVDKVAIKKIYTGKTKSFPSGGSVVAINQSGNNEITAEFNKKLLNKSSSQLKAYWSKQLFTGKGTPPQEIASDAEVLKLVAANPAYIGYVNSSAVTDDVKVVGKY